MNEPNTPPWAGQPTGLTFGHTASTPDVVQVRSNVASAPASFAPARSIEPPKEIAIDFAAAARAPRPARAARPTGAKVTARPTGMQAQVQSSLEIRLFGLPFTSHDSAVQAATTAVSKIAERDPTLALDRWIISCGDPSILSDKSALQNCARIRHSTSERQKGTNTLEHMTRLLDALVAAGHEAFWCGANRNDRRNQAIFTITPIPDSYPATLNPDDTDEFVANLCKDADHEVAAIYNNFRRGGKGQRPTCYVKFTHVASVELFMDYAKSNGPWTYKGHTVQYDLLRTFIPLTPTMIGTTDITNLDPQDLLNEVFQFVDEYNDANGTEEYLLDDSRIWHDSVFVVSCSSFALADYLCTQVPNVDTEYEYVWYLNENGLMPASRKLAFKKREEEARVERSERNLQQAADQAGTIMRMVQSLEKRFDKDIEERKIERRENNMMARAMYLSAKEDTKTSRALATVELDLRAANDTYGRLSSDLRRARRELGTAEDDTTGTDPEKHARSIQRARAEVQDIERERASVQATIDECKTKRAALQNTESPHARFIEAKLSGVCPMRPGCSPPLSPHPSPRPRARSNTYRWTRTTT